MIRFFRTGGPEILKMMSRKDKDAHNHAEHLLGHAMWRDESPSDPDPLDLIERDLIAAPVIEAGRPR